MKRTKSSGGPAPYDPGEQASPPIPRMFFETADDALAAYLVLKGCRRLGFGIGELTEPLPAITHTFDERTDLLVPAVSAFQHGHDDEIAAAQYIRMVTFLQRLRLDETLRRYRQAESDLAKVREPDPDE